VLTSPVPQTFTARCSIIAALDMSLTGAERHHVLNLDRGFDPVPARDSAGLRQVVATHEVRAAASSLYARESPRIALVCLIQAEQRFHGRRTWCSATAARTRHRVGWCCSAVAGVSSAELLTRIRREVRTRRRK
jgi:hypothetical protein